VIYWLDFAWRLPFAVFVRAPLIVVGRGLEWVGNLIANIGDDVPGLPYRPRRRL